MIGFLCFTSILVMLVGFGAYCFFGPLPPR